MGYCITLSDWPLAAECAKTQNTFMVHIGPSPSLLLLVSYKTVKGSVSKFWFLFLTLALRNAPDSHLLFISIRCVALEQMCTPFGSPEPGLRNIALGCACKQFLSNTCL